MSEEIKDGTIIDGVLHVRAPLGHCIIDVHRMMVNLANKENIIVETMFNGSPLQAYPESMERKGDFHLHLRPIINSRYLDPFVITYRGVYNHDYIVAMMGRVLWQRISKEISLECDWDTVNTEGWVRFKTEEYFGLMGALRTLLYDAEAKFDMSKPSSSSGLPVTDQKPIFHWTYQLDIVGDVSFLWNYNKYGDLSVEVK